MNSKYRKSDDSPAWKQRLQALRDDVDLAARLQEIDLLRAELSAQLHEARMRGEREVCDQIRQRKRELLETRRRISASVAPRELYEVPDGLLTADPVQAAEAWAAHASRLRDALQEIHAYADDVLSGRDKTERSEALQEMHRRIGAALALPDSRSGK